MLTNKNLRIIFNDELLHNSKEIDLCCGENFSAVKFCLYDQDMMVPICTMSFSPTIGEIYNGRKGLYLQKLRVHSKDLRRKGIARYYMGKLADFAVKEGYEFISLIVAPEFTATDGDMLKIKRGLKAFYKEFENDGMKDYKLKIKTWTP